MKALLIGLPKCSTCKKAEKFLKDNNIDYDYQDIREDNPSYDQIKEIYQKSSLDIKKFFNTSGMAYRKENLKDKLPQMTEDEKLEKLASDGMLVKRPILIYKDKILVGFKIDQYQEFIK